MRRVLMSAGSINAAVEALGVGQRYRCDRNLNLYKSPAAESLVTQARAGRCLQVIALGESDQAVRVQLWEDDYPGWVTIADFASLSPIDTLPPAPQLSPAEIQARLPGVIAFAQTAMATPNQYLWGGTLGPNYDCSGLVQTAFAQVGIWLPRDAYQQEAFCQPLDLDWGQLAPGDLIFFGEDHRTTHVAIALGDGTYLHSSGKDQGRNGIGIDWLPVKALGEDLPEDSLPGNSLRREPNPVSATYARQLRRPRRVTRSYVPTGFTAPS